MADFSAFIAPTATVVAAGVGAYLSGRMGYRNAESEARRVRRQELADGAITECRTLRDALSESNPEWTSRHWRRVLGDAYDALDAARPLLPHRMRHLKRSIQAACGEALGAVAVFELVDIREEMEPADFDAEWTAYARDYVELAIAALQRWRESKVRDASSVGAATYDDWLRATGRYRPA